MNVKNSNQEENLLPQLLTFCTRYGVQIFSKLFADFFLVSFLGEDDFFFELQVWRRGDSNGAAPPRLLLDSSGPTLPSSKTSNLVWFEKMGFNKRELYITINCEKGLRVQDLFVVGILKLGGQLYASLETSFPAPSSRRKNAKYPFVVPRIFLSSIRSPASAVSSLTSVALAPVW